MLVTSCQGPLWEQELQDMNATAKLVDYDGLEAPKKSQPQDPGSKAEPGAPSASVQTVIERR
jgi:hypothetical protein